MFFDPIVVNGHVIINENRSVSPSFLY